MRATDVEAHVGGVAAVEAVAVDAALELSIVDQRTLVERGEVAFVDAHLAPYLIARFDQAVADTIVDAVRADVDREWLIGVPTIIILSRNSNAE